VAPRNSVDLSTGSVFKRLFVFAAPLVASNLLQHFYHAADIIVIGKFSGSVSLAAVGATGSISSLLLNLVTGLAVGTNVICANLYGAKNKEALSRCMHSSLVLSLVCGIIFSLIGILFAPLLLGMMNCPDNVIGPASLYMRIIFCGVPASLLYNFGSSILRAHGNTKQPMLILTITGLVNVALNLVFVILLRWDVVGVALATITSQIMSVVIVCIILFNPNGDYQMKFTELRLDWKECKKIAAIGIPCGISGITFDFANVMIQSTVNTFGDITIAAASSASNIAAFVTMIPAAFSTACVSFVGQNFGAKQYDRIDKALWASISTCSVFVFLANIVCSLFPTQMLSLYTSAPEVNIAGTPILMIMCWGYLIYVVSQCATGCLRGLGESTIPTLINVIGICAPRLIWVYFIFPLNPTPAMLYICYPVSYFISGAVQLLYYFHCRKKIRIPIAVKIPES